MPQPGKADTFSFGWTLNRFQQKGRPPPTILKHFRKELIHLRLCNRIRLPFCPFKETGRWTVWIRFGRTPDKFKCEQIK